LTSRSITRIVRHSIKAATIEDGTGGAYQGELLLEQSRVRHSTKPKTASSLLQRLTRNIGARTTGGSGPKKKYLKERPVEV